MLDTPLLLEILEVEADELRPIIGDYLLQHSEQADDVVPNEFFHLVVSDLMEGFNFDPFGKAVGDINYVDPLPSY